MSADSCGHSPGPWSFDGPRHNIHVRLANDPNMRVCFMTSNGPTEANARLIAEAPALVDALRDTLNMLRAAHLQCGVHHDSNKRVIKAREVLARATQGASAHE